MDADYQQGFDDGADWLQYQETELRRRFDDAMSNTAHGYYMRENHMKTSEMIQSKFLKKEDFETPKVLTIKDCTLEEVGDDTRWVLAFKEAAKGLVLNVTKIRQLEAAFGHDTDLWVGNKVKLSHDPNVAYAGKIVGGIALLTPPKTGAKPPVAPPPADPDFDQEIPF